MIRFVLRLTLIPAAMGVFIASALLARKCFGHIESLSSLFLWYRRLYVRFALFVLGVKINLKGADLLANHNYLIVSNHLSYLDSLILDTLFGGLFITSVEIGSQGVLGAVSKASGCLFTERRSIWNVKNEIAAINVALLQGHNVVLFPEATTGNGEKLLPFKSTLLQSAVETNTPVLSLCINYRLVSGTPVTTQNRDMVFWYADMTFLPHLLTLFKTKGIYIDVDVLSCLSPQEFPHRKQLTKQARAAIEANFTGISDRCPDAAINAAGHDEGIIEAARLRPHLNT